MDLSFSTNADGHGDVPPRCLFSVTAIFCLLVLLCSGVTAFAQTGGQGALEGTITDPSGALVPKAQVVATAQASGVITKTITSSAGLYSLTPLVPDLYTITITAPGYKVFTQKNIEVNGLNVTGFDTKLALGSDNEVVTVTEAPPVLQTTSATVGAVITDETYESLPLVMNNQQRDPTAFATLAPGAQAGSRAPLFSGTGNYLAEVYIDGIPTTTANQQGDNRVVVNGIPVESVDQLQIISSGPSAEYQGAGAIGFSIKSGGSKYHGQVVDLIRNTAFDTWGFAGNQSTTSSVVNGVITTVPAGKPVEHQNELSASVGGPIPFTRHRGFFFVNYDKFHGRQGVQPATFTLPTPLMRQGNFTELGGGTYIYNPLTNVCTTSASCSRTPFMGLVNGIPTANVIPSTYVSPISQYEQKFLPTPNLAGTVSNYLEGGLSGYDNHELVFNVAYDLNHGQRVSFVYSHGVRQSVGYGAALPVPYTSGATSIISPTMLIFEHSVPLTSHVVNQFKYGFTRFPQPVIAPTDGVAGFSATDAGISGLPVGQASGNFPGSAFGTTSAFTTAQTGWTENGAADASHNVVPNAYTIVDNLTWTKGQHNMTFGIQTQWLQDNTSSQSSPSGVYIQNFAGTSTANFAGNTLSSSTTGYSYASFLLGAVNSGSTSVPLFVETAGRYHPVSPYFQDDWKIRPNLTLNIGLRWDYLPPYHEAQDRWSFFNPNQTNPLTGNMGLLQYAGSRGSAISCQCRTPVQTYWKNFGPRLGMEWAPDPKTVFRVGFAMAYSRAGGVGGRAGDSTGAGQLGFGSSIILPTAINTGVAAAPSYYLNNSTAFTTAGVANTNFGGPGYAIPAPAGPAASSLTLDTGDYLNSAGTYVTAGAAPGYADPYLSGRAPEFEFYNVAMQKVLTKDLTLTVGYSGSESHFVAGAGVSGFWSGQINPAVLPQLGPVVGTDGVTPIISQPANAANFAIAQRASSSVVLPYPTYLQTGTSNSTATIARALRPYPQYSAPPAPEWDNIANIAYNAFEVTLKQREFKGVSFTLNYTYSRNIGDDGTTRSAFYVPAAASSNGVAIPGNNRADRDVVATDTPENLNIYGLAKSPFGKNKIGGDNWAIRNLLGGWQTAGIFTYNSGTPIYVVGSGCTAPSQGTCMPDIVPGRERSIRENGGFGGHGVTYANFSTKQYLDPTAFQEINYYSLPASATCNATPTKCGTPVTMIGDAPRFLGLWSPSHYNLDMALQRTFNITPERVKFVFRADAFDVTNKVTFSIAQTQTVATGIVASTNKLAPYGNTTYVAPGTPSPGPTNADGSANATNAGFGRLSSQSGQRKFQFSGRIQF
ncbi:TonB-dependent receptor [Granulicella paludicola]|uniref:TonB-dependent receptor n=1 Tax=Granulicella paludicola TaxID=474951 RepID=UPI0021E08CB9|nr:carboxypeptidase regulatory-like domain-containing protein [Granulicella paludicola]